MRTKYLDKISLKNKYVKIFCIFILLIFVVLIVFIFKKYLIDNKSNPPNNKNNQTVDKTISNEKLAGDLAQSVKDKKAKDGSVDVVNIMTSANIFYNEGKYRQAVDQIEWLISNSKEVDLNYAPYYTLGLSYKKLGDRDKANKSFDKALDKLTSSAIPEKQDIIDQIKKDKQ